MSLGSTADSTGGDGPSRINRLRRGSFRALCSNSFRALVNMAIEDTSPKAKGENITFSVQALDTPTDPKENPLSPSTFEHEPSTPEQSIDRGHFKWIALALIVSFPIGCNWADNSMGPLKNTVRDELDVNNAQFGVISSASSFVNTIFPIIGGLALDYYGPNIITLMCTSVVFIGAILAALAIGLDQWRVLVGGHIIMGFGVAVLDTATQKFFYHWFGASGYAFAFGIESAVAETMGIIAGITAIPIRNGTGWYGWSFWIPVVICGFSLIMSIVYVLLERNVVPTQHRFTSARAMQIDKEKGGNGRKIFSWNTLFLLPWAFLMLPATQLLQSGAAGGFGVSSADMIRMKGYTEEVSGYMSAAPDVIKIVGSPLVGLAVDRYGHRFHLVALAPIFWIICCALLGFTDGHPLVALVFSSLAGLINSMPLQICFPLLVRDQQKLGTAFGIWRAFNNCGSTIVSTGPSSHLVLLTVIDGRGIWGPPRWHGEPGLHRCPDAYHWHQGARVCPWYWIHCR